MSITIDQIKEIAEREGFTPTGLWDYLQDRERHPECYLPEVYQEMFGSLPDFHPKDLTRKLAREAEGIVEAEPITYWLGFALDSIIRWMGSEGWTPEEVLAVIDDQCFDIGKSTVLILVDQGEEGYGIPIIPEATIRWLYDLLETIRENSR